MRPIVDDRPPEGRDWARLLSLSSWLAQGLVHSAQLNMPGSRAMRFHGAEPRSCLSIYCGLDTPVPFLRELCVSSQRGAGLGYDTQERVTGALGPAMMCLGMTWVQFCLCTCPLVSLGSEERHLWQCPAWSCVGQRVLVSALLTW
jgi:hypothetical protein